MPTTTHLDKGLLAYAIQGRTDLDAENVTDIGGAELRLVARMFSPGVVDSSFAIAVDAGMGLTIGGHSQGDVAILKGLNAGQGNYVVGTLGSLTHTVPASDPSQARTDEVYLVVLDDPFDSTGFSAAVLGYRQGDPGGGAPGPDSSWKAYLKLATIAVAASVSSLNSGNITDNRASAAPAAHTHDWAEVTGKPDLALANHNHDGVYAAASHNHAASQITSGTISSARLPNASTSGAGIVQLSNSTASTSDSTAATSLAVKNAMDQASHAHPYAATSHNHAAGDITSGTIATGRLPSASTSAPGITQLNSSTSSTSVSSAATPSAVKAVQDYATGTQNPVMYGSGSPAGRRIFIQSGTPSALGNGDIWFKI